MMKKDRVFSSAVATLVILGVGCSVESKYSMGVAIKTESLLAGGINYGEKINAVEEKVFNLVISSFAFVR